MVHQRHREAAKIVWCSPTILLMLTIQNLFSLSRPYIFSQVPYICNGQDRIFDGWPALYRWKALYCKLQRNQSLVRFTSKYSVLFTWVLASFLLVTAFKFLTLCHQVYIINSARKLRINNLWVFNHILWAKWCR